MPIENKNKEQIKELLKESSIPNNGKYNKDIYDTILNMPIYSLSKERYDTLVENLNTLKIKLDYWKKVLPE